MEYPNGNYESPVRILQKKLNEAFESSIADSVITMSMEYGIHIDREELIKALQYDRQQYEKGYKDGYDAAMKAVWDLVEKHLDRSV